MWARGCWQRAGIGTLWDAVPEIQRKADIVSGVGEKSEQPEEAAGGDQRLC